MRVAAVQLTSTLDLAANLEAADRLTREAAGRGADVVLLPEKWPALGTDEQVHAHAEPLDGPAMGWARATARELGIDLVAGSFARREPGAERSTNTSVHVGPDGEVATSYDKLHLFDVEVDGVRYAESDHQDAGAAVSVTTLADGTVAGMSVCYDLRFPELYRAHAAAGATVLLVPSAFTLATTRDHWEVLLRARAIEDQCYVIAANQVGEHAPGVRSGGRSMVVDPWGVVVAQASDGPGIVLADLDPERVLDVRRRLPALRHRRPEVHP